MPYSALGGGGFAAEVGGFGDLHLHAVGEFVVADGGFDLWGVADAADEVGVDFFEALEFACLGSGRLAAGDVAHRLAGVDDRAGVVRREEAAAEVGDAAVGGDAAVEDDEAGEVLVGAAEAVGSPGAHAGPAEQRVAGVDAVDGVGVVGGEGGHRADDAEVVGAGAEVGEEVADGKPALAVAFEFPGAGHEVALAVEDGGVGFEAGWFAVIFVELGFRVEGVDLGDAAVHEHEDDALGLGGEVWNGGGFVSGQGLVVEERGEGDAAEAHGGLAE